MRDGLLADFRYGLAITSAIIGVLDLRVTKKGRVLWKNATLSGSAKLAASKFISVHHVIGRMKALARPIWPASVDQLSASADASSLSEDSSVTFAPASCGRRFASDLKLLRERM